MLDVNSGDIPDHLFGPLVRNIAWQHYFEFLSYSHPPLPIISLQDYKWEGLRVMILFPQNHQPDSYILKYLPMCRCWRTKRTDEMKRCAVAMLVSRAINISIAVYISKSSGLVIMSWTSGATSLAYSFFKERRWPPSNHSGMRWSNNLVYFALALSAWFDLKGVPKPQGFY